jgi:hypothetical protein
MAMLTTVHGLQVTFAAKAISGLADHDESTGLAVTCVYGITKGVLQIREDVQEFMTRVRITKGFAQLTRPNNCPVWINGSAVSSIRVPLPNEYVAGVNTVIVTDDFTQGVKEMPTDVTAQINEHGGDL